MNAYLIGLICGVPVGAAFVALAGALRSKLATVVGPVDQEPLTDADRDVIYEEYATHATAMRQQVEHFADTLAGDDVLLRERLRRFEKGGEY